MKRPAAPTRIVLSNSSPRSNGYHHESFFHQSWAPRRAVTYAFTLTTDVVNTIVFSGIVSYLEIDFPSARTHPHKEDTASTEAINRFAMTSRSVGLNLVFAPTTLIDLSISGHQTHRAHRPAQQHRQPRPSATSLLSTNCEPTTTPIMRDQSMLAMSMVGGDLQPNMEGSLHNSLGLCIDGLMGE
jgi:hypothetical protein